MGLYDGSCIANEKTISIKDGRPFRFHLSIHDEENKPHDACDNCVIQFLRLAYFPPIGLRKPQPREQG